MPTIEQESDAVRTVFNRHGFGFQYAVVRECQRLRADRHSAWWVDATEFPVEVNGIQLHIDLILRTRYGCIAAECKRVNPAYGVWAFGRTSVAEREPTNASEVALEQVAWDEHANQVFVRHRPAERTEAQFQVGLDIRTRTEQGDPQGSTRGAWNDALSQALRSAAGIIHTVAAERKLLGNADTMTVIPAVITTARLFSLGSDLADAQLATGELPPEMSVSERKWLWFRTFASANVRQSKAQRRYMAALSTEHYRNQFGSLAALDYARSVAVVTVAGLREFLTAVAPFHVGENY